MSTKRNSITSNPMDNPPVADSGTVIRYDRLTRDHYVWVDGVFLGARQHRHECERLAADHRYNEAKHAGYIEGFRAGLATVR